MADAKSRRSWRMLWVPPLLVVAGAATLLALDEETGLMPLMKLWRRVEATEAGVERLALERDELRGRAHGLRHDPLEVEVLAREQLGMVRPGELVIRWQRMPVGSE